MKKSWIIAAGVLTLLGCTHGNKEVIWDEVSLAKDTAGAVFNLNYPYRFGGDTAVSNAINAAVESYLVRGLPAECDSCSLDSATNLVIREKAADTLLLALPYEFTSQGSVYTKKFITSVKVEKGYYAGGANAYYETQYLNFNNGTGQALRYDDFVSDKKAFARIAREKFLEAKGWKGNETKEETGLFVDLDSLPLPGTIGFTENGLVLFYNLYEIAPRSYGTTEIVIPYLELTTLLKPGILY